MSVWASSTRSNKRVVYSRGTWRRQLVSRWLEHYTEPLPRCQQQTRRGLYGPQGQAVCLKLALARTANRSYAERQLAPHDPAVRALELRSYMTGCRVGLWGVR
jgi:hypothetical protein